MSTLTKNIGLNKPDGTDLHSRTRINNNWDIIDDNIGELLKQSDKIVARGKTGIWTWRKYESGLAECWGVFNYAINMTGGGPVNLYWLNLPNLPFKFTTLTCRILSEGQQNERVHWISGDSVGTTDVTWAGKAYIYSTDTGSMGGNISILVKGTWN